MAREPTWPQAVPTSLALTDAEALRIAREADWHLAAFLAVFDGSLAHVLLVQLGDYARPKYGGNPWTLPGGSVEPDESPSAAARREVREETGLECDARRMRPAAWLARPSYRPHRRNHPGELLLLFAAIADPAAGQPRCRPPETIRAEFVRFSYEDWLSVPSYGSGKHPLQPLRRHWIHWTRVAQAALRGPARPPILWTYESAEAMQRPPWQEGMAHP